MRPLLQLFLLFPLLLLGHGKNAIAPWFTGPLIAPLPEAIAKGNYVVQPYLYAPVNYGAFNSHWHGHSTPHLTSVSPELYVWAGITPWMDLQIYVATQSNFSQGKSYTGLTDLPLGFDFQLLKRNATWLPGIKLSITETFPTGNYKDLSPEKEGTDAIGNGLFSTDITLVLYKIFHLGGVYFITSNFSVLCSLAPKTHLTGFNSYGGGFGTDGSLRAGALFTVIYSLEFSLSRHFAFAIDNVYTHTNRNHFSGNVGTLANGSPATINELSSDQLSFCPALEYNFNGSLGLIGGVWFTALGRNSLQFVSGAISLSYYY